MPFIVRDLMVTVIPQFGGNVDSGGCEACSDAGSASVGSCTSECGVDCQASDEILEIPPYAYIDPPYLLEIGQMLRHALASRQIAVPEAADRVALEESMRPQTLEEIDALERNLLGALEELRVRRAALEQL
jgi:hypothetical protein